MERLRDLAGPLKGQVRQYLKHEADAALASGFAERVIDAPAEVKPTPKRSKPAAPAPVATPAADEK